MEDQDHIGAHKLFNRLLSIDEDNPEVGELIQIMYQNDDQPPAGGNKFIWMIIPLIAASLLTIFFIPQSKTEIGQTTNTNQETQLDNKSSSMNVEPIEVNKFADLESEVDPSEKTSVTTEEKPLNSDNNSANTDKSNSKSEKKRPRKTDLKKTLKTKIKNKKITPIDKIAITKIEKETPDEAFITVTVAGSWADIWIDGKKEGQTGKGAIAVKPGTHELKVVNKYAMPHRQVFTVAPGERKTINVSELKRLPIKLVISSKVYDEDCIAIVDNLSMGTLSKLKYRLKINDSSKSHSVVIKCDQKVAIQKIIPKATPGTVLTLP